MIVNLLIIFVVHLFLFHQVLLIIILIILNKLIIILFIHNIPVLLIILELHHSHFITTIHYLLCLIQGILRI